MNRTALLTALTVVLLGAAGPSAHHAFSAIYRVDERITIEGEIVELGYRNPHSYLHVLAPDDTGQVRRWAVIWGARDSSRGAGVPMVLRVGDRVVVTGSPGRDPGAYLLLMHDIVRPSDGWRWSGAAFRLR